MTSRSSLRLGLLILLMLSPARGFAWSPALEQSLYRDAQRLLPGALAGLMQIREQAALDAARRGPAGLSGLRAELASGQLQPATLTAVNAEMAGAIDMMQHKQLGAGLVRLGALLRLAADVSDPVMTARDGELSPAIAAEYYAFLETNLDKIPVVVDDPHALELARGDLPAYWQALLTRSRDDVGTLRTEMFVQGRVVRHQAIDYRSPVFGICSLAYSRAVNGIAATWLAAWRAVHGDMGRMRAPKIVAPPVIDADALARYHVSDTRP